MAVESQSTASTGWPVITSDQRERLREFAAALRAAESDAPGSDEHLRYVRRRAVLTYTGEEMYGKPAFTDLSKGKTALRVDGAEALVAGERYYYVAAGPFAGLWPQKAVEEALSAAS